ncbi:MAG: LysE family transporter [Chitinophagaceae bacterium]
MNDNYFILLSAVYLGLLLGLFVAISVGPVIFAVIKYSIGMGWKAGLSFIIGVSISDIMYVFLANKAGNILSELLSHERMIGYIGASLFIGIGLYGLFKKIKVTRNKNDMAQVSVKDYWKILASGFLMNTLNPGAILTWITAVAAIATMSSTYRFVFFASCLSLILSLDLLKVFLAQTIRKKLTPRNIVLLNRLSALALVIIGIVLLLKSALNIHLGSF